MRYVVRGLQSGDGAWCSACEPVFWDAVKYGTVCVAVLVPSSWRYVSRYLYRHAVCIAVLFVPPCYGLRDVIRYLWRRTVCVVVYVAVLAAPPYFGICGVIRHVLLCFSYRRNMV